MPCATPPSTCPRHCAGFITKPASAACTDCRIRTSPVSGSTATRTAWTLNDERPLRRRTRCRRATSPSADRCCGRCGRDELGERRRAARPRARRPLRAAVARDRCRRARRRSRACAPERPARGVQRLAGDGDPGRREGAGVVADGRCRSSRRAIRSTSASSTVAAIWRVHRASCRCRTRPCRPRGRYVPSGRSVADVCEMWPPGAMVAIIATAMPSPTRQPVAAPPRRCRGAARPARGRGTGRARSCPRRGRPRARRARSRSGSPARTALRRRSSNGSMPRRSASLSIADSTPRITWPRP